MHTQYFAEGFADSDSFLRNNLEIDDEHDDEYVVNRYNCVLRVSLIITACFVSVISITAVIIVLSKKHNLSTSASTPIMSTLQTDNITTAPSNLSSINELITPCKSFSRRSYKSY